MTQLVDMQVYDPSETYTGARGTPTMVGRAEILAQVIAAIHREGISTILYFTGPGGAGKTRLIQHTLKSVVKEKNLLVASELIDLYHTRNRSVGGLIESMLHVLEPIEKYIQSQSKENLVDEKLEALARAEQEGLSTAELVSRRQELTTSLLEIFNKFTATRRLVLALDTAERLFVARDVAQQRLGLSEQRPAVLEWLLRDFLPKIQNAVILLAGRPQPLNLTADLTKLAQTSGREFVAFDMQGLNEEEALAYFEAVIASAEKSQYAADQQAARAIRSWSLDERLAIFYCLCDEGNDLRIRPILLALAIDHLVVAGRPLAALTRPLAEAQALSNAERRAIENQLGQALVQTLREYRRPADEIIITLGWLRKGADAPLLARLTGLQEDEVERALIHIRDLSFVKERPADNRLFLHDEMYDLLQRNVLSRISPDESEQIYSDLQAYYGELIQTARQRISELYRPQADTFEETLPDPSQVREARSRLQDAMVEALYYRLRWKPVEAFQRYIINATEALVGGDESLWLLLRAELFGFWAERDPYEQLEQIDGLQRADVTADSAVRWVMWLWSQDRYDAALEKANQLADSAHDLIEAGGVLAEAHAQAWRGYLNVFSGNYAQAEQLLTSAENLLDHWAASNRRDLRWAGVFARTYNSLGYLYSSQTRYYEAIEAFAKASQIWQRVQLKIEEATTLNNRAFSVAKIGKFHVALPLAKHALRFREELGPRVPVGLSVNTLALIELAQYDLAGALRDAERACEIFQRLTSPRGIGLALTVLAEAKRRTSVSVTNLQQGRSAQLLAEAAKHATEAIEIFSTKIQEPRRKAEALRERGRVYRDWARLRRERSNIIATNEVNHGKATMEELAQQSEIDFRAAIDLAQNNIYLLNDIKLSLARLYFYTQLYVGAPNYGSTHRVIEQDLLAEIEAAIPAEYRTPPKPSSDLPKVWSLVHAGGLALLRGLTAFNRWYSNQNDVHWFKRAVEQYTVSLAYYHYFSDDIFQEVREASDQIYEQLNLLSLPEKRSLYAIVAGVERQYDLGVGTSRMSQFLHNRFGDLPDFELDSW